MLEQYRILSLFRIFRIFWICEIFNICYFSISSYFLFSELEKFSFRGSSCCFGTRELCLNLWKLLLSRSSSKSFQSSTKSAPACLKEIFLQRSSAEKTRSCKADNYPAFQEIHSSFQEIHSSFKEIHTFLEEIHSYLEDIHSYRYVPRYVQDIHPSFHAYSKKYSPI